jgi:hypothetical protein
LIKSASKGWADATDKSNENIMSKRTFHLAKNDYLLLRYDNTSALKGLATIAQSIWFNSMRTSERRLLKSTITRAIFAPNHWYHKELVDFVSQILDPRDVVHCFDIVTDHPQFIVYPYM